MFRQIVEPRDDVVIFVNEKPTDLINEIYDLNKAISTSSY